MIDCVKEQLEKFGSVKTNRLSKKQFEKNRQWKN